MTARGWFCLLGLVFTHALHHDGSGHDLALGLPDYEVAAGNLMMLVIWATVLYAVETPRRAGVKRP